MTCQSSSQCPSAKRLLLMTVLCRTSLLIPIENMYCINGKGGTQNWIGVQYHGFCDSMFSRWSHLPTNLPRLCKVVLAQPCVQGHTRLCVLAQPNRLCKDTTYWNQWHQACLEQWGLVMRPFFDNMFFSIGIIFGLWS